MTDHELLSKQLEEVKNMVTQNNATQQRILFYLEKDEKTGKPGLVKQVDDLQKTVSDHIQDVTTKEAVKQGKVWLLGTLAGGLGTVVVFLAKIFFSKE